MDANEIYDDEESLEYIVPRARIPQRFSLESKANSRRAELLERTLQFLGPYQGKPRNPKVFAIRTSFLSVDDLEYMLSSAKQWKKNPQACWWKIFNDSKPKDNQLK